MIVLVILCPRPGMRTKTGPNGSADKHVKEIKRKTRRQFSAEEKIRIVLDGLRGESSISELCRPEGIAESLYYNWSKDFMEAGKKRLAGYTTRQATSSEVTGLVRRLSMRLVSVGVTGMVIGAPA